MASKSSRSASRSPGKKSGKKSAEKPSKKSSKLSAVQVAIENFGQIMKDGGFTELEWEDKEFRIRLCTHSGQSRPNAAAQAPMAAQPVHTALHSAPAPAANPGGETSPATGGKLAANQKQVISPFVGTFYRSPSPSAEHYVKEGQHVKRGDTLCIIEAMKLMNGIEAEFSGKILSVLVENGQPVEFGEPLFLIET